MLGWLRLPYGPLTTKGVARLGDQRMESVRWIPNVRTATI